MYSFSSRVRYTEIDRQRNLDLYSMLNYFQDCSTFHSFDLGVGINYLEERQRVWLLSSWQVELFQPPKLFDNITIATSPYDFKGLYGYRNFVLYNESKNHEVAACANSIWFLMDTATMRPTRITAEDSSCYLLKPPYPMEYAPRKISLPDNFAQLSSAAEPAIPVTEHLLDTNHHVNNAQYVRLAMGCLPEDFTIHRMRAEYRKSAVSGDQIVPVFAHIAETNQYIVSLNDTSGQTFAIVEFS